MKDQSPLSASEMREAFDKARAQEREDLATNGAGKILQYLSESIGALQANGAPVSITAGQGSHSNAYDMMYTVSGNGGGTIDAYGFILCGETSHLWAVASVHDDKRVERLYISKENAGGEGGRSSMDAGKSTSRTVIPGACYDFGEDPEALKKVQQRIIAICAGDDAMLENDRSNVFNREPSVIDSLKKPAPKFRL